MLTRPTPGDALAIDFDVRYSQLKHLNTSPIVKLRKLSGPVLGKMEGPIALLQVELIRFKVLTIMIILKQMVAMQISIIIIIKKDRQCKAGRGRLTPYQSEDPSPTLPTYRGKEEKGKTVEDKKGESN